MKIVFWKLIVGTRKIWEILLLPAILTASLLLLLIRKIGVYRMKYSKKIFLWVGVFPLRNHYYEPLFNPKYLRYSLRRNRILPGINFNIEEQLYILSCFQYNHELEQFPTHKNKNNKFEYYYLNGSFEMGDSEYLYNLIRLKKPNKIIEIGSGYSTLVTINAIKNNINENPAYNCEVVCIEPYEMPWLEELNVKIIRDIVEEQPIELFQSLQENDFLFIDSSHIIRPQGDVLFEFLEVLPILNSGVIVHIHDIFTPKDYLDSWVIEQVRLWNEQYILEAFLSMNSEYRVIGALNYLKNNHYKELLEKTPIMAKYPDYEPRSFYIQKN